MASVSALPTPLRRSLPWRGALLLAALLPGAGAGAMPLWQIEGESNRIYILGSMHLLPPGRVGLPEPVIAAYEDADVLVMEIDLDALDPGQSQETVMRLGIDPQGRTLATLLGARDYAAAEKKAAALGIELTPLEPFEPWMAAITITQMQLLQLGFSVDSGIEQQLLRRARRDGKAVRGLETLEEQLSALDSPPLAAQREFLLTTLDEAAGIEERIEDLVTAWQQADLPAMERELLQTFSDQPELYRRMVVERNRNWVRQIEKMQRDRRNYLVVVGTLHLIGPDSVIRQLSAGDALVTELSPGASSAASDAGTPASRSHQ